MTPIQSKPLLNNSQMMMQHQVFKRNSDPHQTSLQGQE
jgi:hypothetical protein